MSDVTTARLEEVEPYSGPHALEGIRFRPLARALGVTAWGMNLIQIDPGAATYPTHDHAGDGQEEVFVVLEGDAVLRADGEDRVVGAGSVVRIGPGVERTWRPGAAGVTLLALGGTPGKPYEPRA